MPTIISAVSFSTTFQVGASPQPTFLLTDTTDYTTPSIPTTGVKGVFTIISPGGTTYYQNTNYAAADIVRNVSANNAIPITLPLLPNGTVVQGTYTITYTVQITDGVNPVYYVSQTYTYNYNYCSPRVCINQVVDCIAPLFTSTDTTNYVVNSVTPTITRTQTVSFPAVVSPLVSSAPTITTGVFYQGETGTVISTILAYTFSNYFVTDLVTGTKFTSVNCEWTCKVACCVKEFNQKLEYASRNNVNEYQILSSIAGVAAFKLSDLMLAISCGKPQNISQLIAEIQDLLECHADCGCNDGNAKLVVGLGGGGSGLNFVVVSGNSGITVTSATVGNTTTYTITLSQALINQINASYNTVVTNTDSTITVTSSGIIDGVQTYTLSVPGAFAVYQLLYSNPVPVPVSGGSAEMSYVLPSILANTMQVGDIIEIEIFLEPTSPNTSFSINAGSGGFGAVQVNSTNY